MGWPTSGTVGSFVLLILMSNRVAAVLAAMADMYYDEPFELYPEPEPTVQVYSEDAAGPEPSEDYPYPYIPELHTHVSLPTPFTNSTLGKRTRAMAELLDCYPAPPLKRRRVTIRMLTDEGHLAGMQTIVCGLNTAGLPPPRFLVPVGNIRFSPDASIMSQQSTSSGSRPTQRLPFILPRPEIVIEQRPNGEWAQVRGENLRRKIEQRPSRDRLVTQNILLSDGRVAPLIEQRARLLRQERIKSKLNKKLGQRPGVLELVTRKILQADHDLEQAISEGKILFQATSDHEEEPDEQGLITTDMEVVSQVMVRQPPKSINILANKGILRKSSKMSPYKPIEPMQFQGKTKTPDRKDDEVTVIEERLNNSSNITVGQVCRGPTEQSSYELLLQQQQLFLQWQQQEGVDTPTQSEDNQVIELQRGNSPGGVNCILGQPLKVRRLSDFKVQELKNECKKRQLPVSGAKPQLLERLRSYEREILGSTPPPSPELLRETSHSTPDLVQTIDSSQDSNMQPQTTMLHQPSPPSSHSSHNQHMGVSNGMSMDNQPRQLHLAQPHEYSRQAPLVLHVQSQGPQLVQLVDEKGSVLGMATVQYQQPQQDMQRQNTVVIQQQPRQITSAPISAHAMDSVQQMTNFGGARVVQASQIVQKPTENTFRFAQMGSGGQFTVVSEAQQKQPIVISQSNGGVAQTIPQLLGTTQYSNGHIVQAAPIMMGGMIQQNLTNHAPMKIAYQPQTMAVQHQDNNTGMQQTKGTMMMQQQNGNQSMQQSNMQNVHQSTNRLTSPQLQSSPRTADQPGSSPNMPHGGGIAQVEIITCGDKDDDIIALDPSDPASVLTPSTLLKHEEMLRSQHKLIENMGKEIATSQTMLKKQQQIILAAKKAQQKLREQQRFEGDSVRSDQLWLRDLDIRHVNKQHIQQFLQNKIHVTNLNNVSSEHNRIKMTEARLQEELHVDQAVNDIVRLIKQDPRTALLIVQLLRKYQLERSNQETCQEDNDIIEEVEHIPHENEKPEPNQHHQSSTVYNSIEYMNQNQQMDNRNDSSIVVEASGKQPFADNHSAHHNYQEQPNPTVEPDMEDIFRCVLEEATRALRDPTPVQNIDCTVSAKMKSPRQTTDEHPNWNSMMHQSTSANLVGLPDNRNSLNVSSNESSMMSSPLPPSNQNHQHILNQHPSHNQNLDQNQNPMQLQDQHEDHHQEQMHNHQMDMNDIDHFDIDDHMDQFPAFQEFPSDNSYSSLDDVMAVVQADPDFQGTDANFNYTVGDEELTNLLGGDASNWLNIADRSIGHDGQFDSSFLCNDLDDGRSTDPMSLGVPLDAMDSTENDQPMYTNCGEPVWNTCGQF